MNRISLNKSVQPSKLVLHFCYSSLFPSFCIRSLFCVPFSFASRVSRWTLCLCLAVCSAVVWAQGPEVSGVLPCGGQRGTTAIVRVDGKSLQGARAWISGAGMTIEKVEAGADGNSASVRLLIALDAPLGPRELRVGTAKGVSRAVRLWVDAFAEREEVEPNDTPAQAQLLTSAPVVINGRIGAAMDRDVFAFDARAGETWVFDVNAARLRSRLDPVLELRDARGNLLQMAQSAWETDPRLIRRFDLAGRYYVTLRDTQFLGGPDYAYRLTAGVAPVVASYFPLGGVPGSRIPLSLTGLNLGRMSQAEAVIPPDAMDTPLWVSAQTPNGPALPFPLFPDAAPAQTISPYSRETTIAFLPALLDGCFQNAVSTRFRLPLRKGESTRFDLLGRRIGSRIDGYLRVLDTNGKELAANDDNPDTGKDARLDFTPPADGVYIVEASNVDGKTGMDCYYRLRAFRPVADFRLVLNTDRLQVGTGGTLVAPITVERQNGFGGDIRIDGGSVFAGVTSSGGVIAAGQNSVEITLTSAPGTGLTPDVIQIVGKASIQGRIVSHPVVCREQVMPRAIDPALFQDDSYRSPFRDCLLLPLAVVERTEPFALSTSVSAITLAPGAKAEIVVKASRRAGANGEIKLELRNLPDKVTAAVPAIAANQTEAHIVLTAAPDAPAAIRNLIVQGRLDNAVQPAPAITLTARK